MKTKLFASFVAALTFLSTLHAQETAFTYQGRLTDDGSPANGYYDMLFSLYDAASGGNQVDGTLSVSALCVSNGLFTATLDFGSGIFTGAARWLKLDVRTNGAGPYIPLGPRQAVTATPYAIVAGQITGTVQASQIGGTLTPAQLPAGVVTNGSHLIYAEDVVANSLSGDGSNITGLAFVRTNETRPIINTEGISSSNTMTASNFVSTIYQPQDTQMLALNYYPGSTNYLMYRAGQLAFAPSSTGQDNGIVWGGSYMRFGGNPADDGSGVAGWLVRSPYGIGFETPDNFKKIRIGDDHRLDQMMEMSAGTIPGAENDDLDTYGFGHWWQKQHSHILAMRSHSTNNYYCWVGLQSVYPDESTIYWSEKGSSVGAATLRAYWSLPPRLSNELGGWQMTQATNIIFEGGKWGFNAFNNFFVTNQTGQSNIAIISSAGSIINGVGFTNNTISIRTNDAPLDTVVVKAWIPIVGTNGQTYLVPGYQ